jgi:hypothetical protein
MELIRNIRSRRLQWVVHMMRMQEEKVPRQRIHRREKISWKAQGKMVR